MTRLLSLTIGLSLALAASASAQQEEAASVKKHRKAGEQFSPQAATTDSATPPSPAAERRFIGRSTNSNGKGHHHDSKKAQAVPDATSPARAGNPATAQANTETVRATAPHRDFTIIKWDIRASSRTSTNTPDPQSVQKAKGERANIKAQPKPRKSPHRPLQQDLLN